MKKKIKLVDKELFFKVEKLTNLPHILIISWLRRAGKSILLKQVKKHFYNKEKNILWFWSVNTVKSYINFLENSYLLFQVEKFDYSLKKQIVNNKKIYCIDNDFYNLVWFSFLQNNLQKLEKLVFIELKRKWYEIYYHKAKKECDFLILDRGNIVWAIQVSWNLYDADTKK